MKRTLSTLIVVSTLSACSWPIKPSPEPSPLVVSNCPKLTPLESDSFGAVVKKLAEVSGQYYECRAAAGIKN